MLQEQLNSFIHKRIALDVEYNAGLARQFGFAIPKNYQMGFSATSGPVDLQQRKWWMVMTLRLDDYRKEFKVKLPGHDHDPDENDLVGDLFRCAGELVHGYIEAHPEMCPSGDVSKTVLELMTKVGSDEEFHKRAIASSATATYREGG